MDVYALKSQGPRLGQTQKDFLSSVLNERGCHINQGEFAMHLKLTNPV